MRAVVFTEYGGPEVLHVADVEAPHAGPGQVRIAVRAAGVNPLDWKIRSGAMAQVMPASFPVVTGYEAAGVVDEVGDGVTGVGVGDEVFGATVAGAAAEHALLDDWAIRPEALPSEQAAGLPVAAETSLRVFGLLGGLGEGRTILIDGAAGGIGAVAVQLAVALGARVIGTASARNHDFLRELGAEPTTYGDGLEARVRELAPDGVDVAFDVVGKGGVDALVALVRGDPARVVSIADFSAAERGVQVTTGAESRDRGALTEAARFAAAGRLTVPVAAVHPFADAAAAHRESEAGHVRGKLILVP